MGETKELTATGPSEKLARARLKEKIEVLQRTNTLRTGNPPLNVFLDDFLREKVEEVNIGRLSPNTVESYSRLLEKHIRPALGQHSIASMSVRVLQGFMDALHEHGGLTSQRKTIRTILRQTLRMAVSQGFIDANPMTEVRIVRQTRPDTWALSFDEVAELRRAVAVWAGASNRTGPVNDYLEDFVDIALGTGMRISEILGLSHEACHLDEEKPWISIDKAVTVPIRGGGIRVEKPKGHKTRAMFIPSFVAEILRRRRNQAIKDRGIASGPVLQSRTGEWLRSSSVRRALRSALEEADLTNYPTLSAVTPHALRRTAATQVTRSQGVDSASRLLGHADTITTRRYYVAEDATPADTGDALEALAPDRAPEPPALVPPVAEDEPQRPRLRLISGGLA